MYISKIQLTNYKSYREPAALELKPGFNVVTGQNNAGKTALLEALTLDFGSQPHRSITTVPYPGAMPPGESSVQISYAIRRDEMIDALKGTEQRLSMPLGSFQVPSFGPFQSNGPGIDAFLSWLFSQETFLISVSVSKSVRAEIWREEHPAMGVYPSVVDQGNLIIARFDETGKPHSAGLDATRPTNISVFLAQALKGRTYRFSAERFNVGQGPFGNNPNLAPNAQNLPEVLNVLQHNTGRLMEFGEVLSEILPQVKHVSVRPLGGSHLEITVWPHALSTKREDIAIPLNQCGTGVGQVLAILYLVMTSTYPRTIIIDEPQSFLHPGAVRKLIEVLKRYPQHQYIFATHSATVLTACDPATVTLTRLTSGETSLASLNATDTKDLQVYLADIGARLADVFGADKILWSEGQTEEICFPRILACVAHKSPMGTAIIALRRTGDLEGRDAKRIIEIYISLTKSNALLPPAVAFLLDGECRTEQETRDLEKHSQGLARFLPRRMFENYLLSPNAVAAVANSIGGFRERPVTVEEVAELIRVKSQNLKYYCKSTMVVPPEWQSGIDGARLLKEIFAELSESRVVFDKIKHSVAISDWLIEHDPDQLKEVAQILVSLLA